MVDVKRRDDQDPGRRSCLGEDGAGSPDAIERGHLYVHHEHVRREADGLGDGLLAVLGLADYLDVVLGVEDHREARSDHVLVVGEHNTDRHQGASSGIRAWTAKPRPSRGPVTSSPP